MAAGRCGPAAIADEAARLERDVESRWRATLGVDALLDDVEAGRYEEVRRRLADPVILECLATEGATLVAVISAVAATAEEWLYQWIVEGLDETPRLVHVRAVYGMTLLDHAASAWNARLAGAVLARGADPNSSSEFGHTALYYAGNRLIPRPERHAHAAREIVDVLCRHGADVNRAGLPQKTTPLHMAARRGNVAIAEALLDCGANVEARDSHGETPLRRAVNCKQVDVVRLLLRRGADRLAPDNRGVTPMGAATSPAMLAVLSGNAVDSPP